MTNAAPAVTTADIDQLLGLDVTDRRRIDRILRKWVAGGADALLFRNARMRRTAWNGQAQIQHRAAGFNRPPRRYIDHQTDTIALAEEMFQ